MKYSCLLGVIFLSPVLHSQTQMWIDLKYPQSNLLGSAILKIENGVILENHLVKKDIFSITQAVGPEYFTSCENQLKSKVESQLKKRGFEISSVKIKDLKIKSISSEDIGKIDACNCIVYEGMCAESYEINLSKKSKYSSADLLLAILPTIVDTSILLKTKLQLDSIIGEGTSIYTMRINSPEVFFKIRILRFTNILTQNKYNHTYFTFERKGTTKFHGSKIPLKTYELNGNDVSNEMRPGSFIKNEFDRNKYKIFVTRDQQGMHIFIKYKEDKPISEWKTTEIKESFITNGMKNWGDQVYVNCIVKGKLFKSVYLTIYAEQVADNKIIIYNYDRSGNSLMFKSGLSYTNWKIENIGQNSNCLDNMEQIIDSDFDPEM